MDNVLKVIYTFNGKEITYNESFDGNLTMKSLDSIAWKAGQVLNAIPKSKTSGITESVKTLQTA